MAAMSNLHEDAALIDALGGSAQLARSLGFASAGAVQRVQNWKYRGIPEVIRLRHPEAFVAPPAADTKAAT